MIKNKYIYIFARDSICMNRSILLEKIFSMKKIFDNENLKFLIPNSVCITIDFLFKIYLTYQKFIIRCVNISKPNKYRR